MKITLALLVVGLAASAMGSAVPPTFISHKILARFLKDCNVNLCWAFDGSSSMVGRPFTAQKNFANRLGSVINFGTTPTKMGAVQYGTVVRPVQRLTASGEEFLVSVDAMKQIGGRTNIDGGLFACRVVLDNPTTQARHIILLTDGSATIGAAGFEQAEEFRATGGLVSIIASGHPNQAALEKLAGSSGKVYNVRSFADDIAMFRITQNLGTRVCSNASR